MKLITKLVLLCAAAFALAAATDDSAAPAMPADAPAPWQVPNWPESVVPPTATWAGLFSAGWR